jgi:protocatechuate 3,4-dioxygenase beta subunit
MTDDDPRSFLSRRRALTLLGTGALALLAGCGRDDDSATEDTTTPTASGSSSTGSADDCTTIPEETAGPYPGDGTNGPDVLTADGVVRRDIRSSFGSSTTTAEGVPLTINVDLLDSTGCTPLAGAAVYVWHCDRDGGYSMYSEGLEGENYLRGVQEADADGRVTFTSIFPGAYLGRWPHIHFEVYESLAAATGGGTRNATSQIALPEGACTAVYATSGYEQSASNMPQTTLSNDNVFGDDEAAHQLGTTTGSPAAGYAVTLRVPVDPDHESSGASMGGGPPR